MEDVAGTIKELIQKDTRKTGGRNEQEQNH